MRSVWKWAIPTKTEFVISMPINAKFLHLTDHPQLAMWWEIPDTGAPKESHTFKVFGTGWEMPDTPMVYLGTVFQGPFVFHVYDEVERKWVGV